MSESINKNYSEEKETLVDKISNLENYYVNNLLSNDLKDIYSKIQQSCSDFRENVFFKNIAILEYNLGKSVNPTNNNREDSDKEHNDNLKEIKSYEEMLNYYKNKTLD